MNELQGIPEGEPILILNKDGSPLMPTFRHAHAQRLLDKGKAYLVTRVPWVIRLKYQIDDPKTQPITIGIDPGRQNIGVSIVTNDTHTIIHRSQLETDNKQVTQHMTKRRQHRQASRRGERLRRKRRAKRNGQQNQRITRDGGRRLASCKEMIPVKDIFNTEARFSNRERKKGRITPTVRNLVECHINLVRQLMRLIPITNCCFEWNKFAFMQMEDGTIQGVDFQNGRMRGFANMHDYVSNLQNGVCYMLGCQEPIAEYHHVLPRSRRGSNRPENIVGLCKECHERVHLGELSVIGRFGESAPFAGLSVLNQAVPRIYQELIRLFGEGRVSVCSGFDTRGAREYLGLGKDHDLDGLAIIVACMGWLDISGVSECHCCVLHRFRRHDRAVVKAQRERSYKLDGRVVAKNRWPRFEQPKQCPALSGAGLSREDVSRLVVVRSKRSYNDLGRIMPGAVFDVEGYGACVMTGQQSRGRSLLFKHQIVDSNGKPIAMSKKKKCKLVRHNQGIIFTNYRV